MRCVGAGLSHRHFGSANCDSTLQGGAGILAEQFMVLGGHAPAIGVAEALGDHCDTGVILVGHS